MNCRRRTTGKGELTLMAFRPDFVIPLLSKEGQARSAGVVCSKTRSDLIDAGEALLIDRYCSSLNRPPRFRFAKAPRLT